MSRDYYAVLEIGVGATPAQVKRAYQRLARRYSPDVNLWDRDAQALFEEIVEAYRVLSDGNFRDVVLGLLFLSGIGLVWSSLGLR